MKMTKEQTARVKRLAAILEAAIQKEYAAYKIENDEAQRLHTFTKGFHRGMDFIIDGRKNGWIK
tara:strand:- start:83 stop:274 length:192 start_codon:yes stop_codon:yes gene_type:complete